MKEFLQNIYWSSSELLNISVDLYVFSAVDFPFINFERKIDSIYVVIRQPKPLRQDKLAQTFLENKMSSEL